MRLYGGSHDENSESMLELSLEEGIRVWAFRGEERGFEEFEVLECLFVPLLSKINFK
jgi:ABC-type uncharacterized transport system ATPase component